MKKRRAVLSVATGSFLGGFFIVGGQVSMFFPLEIAGALVFTASLGCAAFFLKQEYPSRQEDRRDL